MKKSYFKIFKDSAGEWRWTLYAANHEPVAVSDTRRESAEAMALKLWHIAYEAVKQQLVIKPVDILGQLLDIFKSYDLDLVAKLFYQVFL